MIAMMSKAGTTVAEWEELPVDFEEDRYFDFTNASSTPSLDEEEAEEEDDEDGEDARELNDYVLSLLTSDSWKSSSFSISEDAIVDEKESCFVETEFVVPSGNDADDGRAKKIVNRLRRMRTKKGGKYDPKTTRKEVRVTFQDVSKPYVARITSAQNYHRFLQLVKEKEDQLPGMIRSPDAELSEFQALSEEDQEKQKQEWTQELAKVEDEIETLRVVLASKQRSAHELKRKLGISVWKEFQDDMSQSIRNVKESNVYQNVEEKIEQIGKAVTEAPLYQKTESVVKSTAEKTSSIIGGFGSGLTSKLGQLKNSDSFRSFEEKVGSVYENTLASRSNSMVGIDESGKEADTKRSRSASNTPATTPIIPE